jgi:hypothetical protein
MLSRRLLISSVTMILAAVGLVIYFLFSFMYGIIFGFSTIPFVFVYAVAAIVTVFFCWYISSVRRANDI